MNNYKISAFIDEHSDDLNTQVEALKKYGIKYVELRHCNGKNVAEFTPEDLTEIKSAFDNAGISVSSIGSPIGKIPVDGNIEDHLKTAEKLFAMANALGTKYVRMFSFYIPDGKSPEDYREIVISHIGRLIDAADKYGVVLCHENEAKIYGESPERCLDLLMHFGGKLRCVFDMGNFVLDGYEPYPHAFGILKDYIEYFHIKDALYQGAIVPAGLGEASVRDVLTSYVDLYKKDVFVTLEPHLQTFAGLNALVGKSFDNPYKYENQQVAFDDDVDKFFKLMKGECDEGIFR